MIEHDGNEGFDVDDGGGLRPDGFVGSLVLAQGDGAEAGLLGATCFFSMRGFLGREMTGFGFLGEATIFSGLGSCGRGGVAIASATAQGAEE